MAKTRLLNPTLPKRGDLSLQRWVALGKKALQAAETAGDKRRARIIQEALKTGDPSKGLKRLGIICEMDIQREFSSTN